MKRFFAELKYRRAVLKRLRIPLDDACSKLRGHPVVNDVNVRKAIEYELRGYQIHLVYKPLSTLPHVSPKDVSLINAIGDDITLGGNIPYIRNVITDLRVRSERKESEDQIMGEVCYRVRRFVHSRVADEEIASIVLELRDRTNIEVERIFNLLMRAAVDLIRAEAAVRFGFARDSARFEDGG